MSLTEVKDRSLNQKTVDSLEKLLKRAKSGELRTIITISGWDDDHWSSSWSLDTRSDRKRMLGEISMLQFEMQTNAALENPRTVLSKAFDPVD